MTTKALGNSISQRLINLQKKTSVPYANLVTVFFIECAFQEVVSSLEEMRF
jgi:hypothetical protein